MPKILPRRSLPISTRLQAFMQLGEALPQSEAALAPYLEHAVAENPWFTTDNVRHALARVCRLLRAEQIEAWLRTYVLPAAAPRCVGLVPAGNIPLMGFHDLLAVLISGHVLHIKPSRRDRVLMRLLTDMLFRVCPAFAPYVHYPERLTAVDALIATGSNDTVAHFVRYFGHLPHIVRGSRSSCALLRGNEPPAALTALGEDVFRYFGLGCRSVSKLYLPRGYDISRLIAAWQPYSALLQHNRYANHCLYQQAMHAAAGEDVTFCEFLLLKPEKALHSPIGVLHYETYEDEKEVHDSLCSAADQFQAIYTWPPSSPTQGQLESSEAFGTAQQPALDTYADNIDTMAFLSKLYTHSNT